MESQWLEMVSWIALALGFASALVIALDELALGHRQHMAAMNLVHPITALYWGPVWVWLYFTRARRSAHDALHADAQRLARGGVDTEKLRQQGASTQILTPWNIGNAVSHCGAGCTLGDIGGEWIVWAVGLPMLGLTETYGPTRCRSSRSKSACSAGWRSAISCSSVRRCRCTPPDTGS